MKKLMYDKIMLACTFLHAPCTVEATSGLGSILQKSWTGLGLSVVNAAAATQRTSSPAAVSNVKLESLVVIVDNDAHRANSVQRRLWSRVSNNRRLPCNTGP